MNSSTFRPFQNFFYKYEFILPLALFLLFLAITLPGISWGAPDIWHPDEIVSRVIKALHGEWRFSEINFDYPDLPQYVMFGLGKVVLALGYSDAEVLVASRGLSAVLAGLTILLAYGITRRISGNVLTSTLAATLLLCVSALTHNGRFAHNDTYIAFFAALSVLFLVNYRSSNRRGWLYASFLTVGMAASCKYNGISLVLAPAAIYLISRRATLSKRPLRTLETIFISGALTFLGFAIGTPKAFFWMSYYFKRMVPALLHTGNYARQPDSVRGIFGQYGSFADGTGQPLFILFAAAFVWAVYKVVLSQRSQPDRRDPQAKFLAILLFSILALDLPIMISYNYVPRFFLSMYPLFAVLGALFAVEMFKFRQYQKLIGAALVLLILFSFARNISVMLLFLNDARIAASKYIDTLPFETSLEYTYYPPSIPRGHFEREHNYPLYFKKAPDEALPTSRKYDFNVGEIGLDKRQTDYLVVDSFTSSRFGDPFICETMPAECDFFQQLETGQSNHYKLIAKFDYSLPSYLPKLSISFVNPGIRIYERIP